MARSPRWRKTPRLVAPLAPSSCSTYIAVRLYTDLPTSTLSRFLATCTQPPQAHGYLGGMFTLATSPGMAGYRVMSQLAQSDLIRRIEIECEPREYVN